MTDIWSIGITVRTCDCRSQDEGSTPLWTANKLSDIFWWRGLNGYNAGLSIRVVGVRIPSSPQIEIINYKIIKTKTYENNETKTLSCVCFLREIGIMF